MRKVKHNIQMCYGMHSTHVAFQGVLGCFVMAACFLSASAQEMDELEQLKESLKREIMREMIEDSRSGVSSDDMEVLKQQIKQEILEELRQQMKTDAPLHEGPSARVDSGEVEPEYSNVSIQQERHPQGVQQPVIGRGHAEGYVLEGKRGIAGCTVKLLRLTRPRRRQGYQEEVEYQTVTSADGLYRFENIPEGKYALKWQLPGEEGWIRRLHKEADVTVEPGRTQVIKPVNMSNGVVPR